MTDAEFSQFAKRLFVEYPSLYEWLQRNSPDPRATQEAWRERMRRYTLDECMKVLDDWSAGRTEPFKAYEKDYVALSVMSAVDKRREAASKREQQAEMARQFQARRDRNKRDEYQSITKDFHENSENRRVMEECRPHHQRMLDGEISKSEFDDIFEASWAKHVEPVPQDWVA